MAYYIDLKKISIDQYKKILESADLIPSWMILKEDSNKNLDIIKGHNIKNLDELHKRIKDTKKVQDFANESGLPEKYLAVLRRALNGYQPKPNRIKDFPSIGIDVVDKLERLGIKNTKELYEEILTPKKRRELSKRSGIDIGIVEKLAQLTDLSRIRWVNHTFANVLLEAGYCTAEEVAKADYSTMYEEIRRLNKERELYKGNIGAHDMKLCVEAAQGLDFDIQY